MTSRHCSANERTSRRIAAIADELLRCKTFVDYRRSWLMWSDIYELAQFIKASTPRHRRLVAAPRPQSKKAGTKSRGKGAKPLGHYTPRKIELRKRKGQGSGGYVPH